MDEKRKLEAVDKAVSELKALAESWDTGAAHSEADDVLCRLLCDLGFDEVVDAFSRVPNKKALAAAKKEEGDMSPAEWAERHLRDKDGYPLKLWPHQRAELESDKKDRVIMGGHETGKTTAMLIRALWLAHTMKGRVTLVVASSALCDIAMRDLARMEPDAVRCMRRPIFFTTHKHFQKIFPSAVLPTTHILIDDAQLISTEVLLKLASRSQTGTRSIYGVPDGVYDPSKGLVAAYKLLGVVPCWWSQADVPGMTVAKAKTFEKFYGGIHTVDWFNRFLGSYAPKWARVHGGNDKPLGPAGKLQREGDYLFLQSD